MSVLVFISLFCVFHEQKIAANESWITNAVEDVKRKFLHGYKFFLPADIPDSATYAIIMAYKTPPPPPAPPSKEESKKDKEKDKSEASAETAEKEKEADDEDSKDTGAAGGGGVEESQWAQLKEIVVMRVTNVTYVFDVFEYGRR